MIYSPFNLENFEDYEQVYDRKIIMGLLKFQRIKGFHLYQQLDNRDCFICFCITIEDYMKTFPFDKKYESKLVRNNAAQIHTEMIDLTVELFDNMKCSFISRDECFFEEYFFLHSIFPDNNEIKNKPIKKIEFETGTKIISQLEGNVAYRYQENLANYKADFILKSCDIRIPEIILEIDENGHKSYDKKKEEKRKQVLNSFTSHIIRISISDKMSQQERDIKISETVETIKNLIKDLKIHYTPGITLENFREYVRDCNIEEEFLKLFWMKNDVDPIFKYRHDEIAKYLGYKEGNGGNDNFRTFRDLIKRVLKEDIEYRISLVCNDTSEIPSKWGGQLKQTILITRIGFFKLCMFAKSAKKDLLIHYFAIVYEKALELTEMSKSKVIDNNLSINDHQKHFNERVTDKVEEKLLNNKMLKIKKENEELISENNKIKEEIIQAKDQITNLTRVGNNETVKYYTIMGEISLLQSKYLNIKKRNKLLESYNIQLADKVLKFKEIKDIYKTKYVELTKPTVTSIIEQPKGKFDFDPIKLNSNTVVQLKNICKNNNICKYSAKTKQELINLILQHKNKLLCI